MKTLLSEQVKVFITDKITVMKGAEVLLNTINNIHSYHKLMDTLITDYVRLNYKKVIPIVEDFIEIDRKNFRNFRKADKEEAMKSPLIRVMKNGK